MAAAAGIELHDDPWEMNVLATRRGSAHYPSMLEDVRSHRPTEIDLITGALVREADQCTGSTFRCTRRCPGSSRQRRSHGEPRQLPEGTYRHTHPGGRNDREGSLRRCLCRSRCSLLLRSFSQPRRPLAPKPIVIGWAFDSKGAMAPFDNPALAAANVRVGQVNARRVLKLLLRPAGSIGRVAAARLLVFEDVHWADRSSRDFLSFFVRNARHQRIAAARHVPHGRVAPAPSPASAGGRSRARPDRRARRARALHARGDGRRS